MKEFWNERYSHEAYAFGTSPNDFLTASVNLFSQPSRILCLAEGEGRNAVFLALEGHEVYAVDQSEAGKAKALKLAKEHGVSIHYQIGDLSQYDMGIGAWDGIISISAHTPSVLRKHILTSAKHALKPGGIFLLEGYNAEQLRYGTGGPKDEDMLFSLDELNAAFCDCTILHAKNTIRDIQEGLYHSGKSSVTQFIARK